MIAKNCYHKTNFSLMLCITWNGVGTLAVVNNKIFTDLQKYIDSQFWPDSDVHCILHNSQDDFVTMDYMYTNFIWYSVKWGSASGSYVTSGVKRVGEVIRWVSSSCALRLVSCEACTCNDKTNPCISWSYVIKNVKIRKITLKINMKCYALCT